MSQLIKPVIKSGTAVPIYSSGVSAGFPSPADDHIEACLDLNQLCISNNAATYFIRASGDSMTGAGIYSGDVLVVDRSINAKSGDIIIAALYGEFTVKRLHIGNTIELRPENPEHSIIVLAQGEELDLFGVVMYCIHSTFRTKE
jgi:DNA polymerase V